MSEANGFLYCNKCKNLFSGELLQNGIEVWGDEESLRLENNPAVWGALNPRIYLLGFSKGDKQNKELLKVKAGDSTFDEIPFKGMRHRLKWLLVALGLIHQNQELESLFRNSEQNIQTASLIRCSLSARSENGEYFYKMKDILNADPVLLECIATNCMEKYLADAEPGSMFILLGLDQDYINLCKRCATKLFGSLTSFQKTTYKAGDMWFAHVAHPSSNQTDPQYMRWVKGKTKEKKVLWAYEAITMSGVVDS